ncbi:DUF3619 family protein [Nitrosomonas sp. Nm166]|uniref:DUF3619 family protein n=1 Tax=Nitrosomonas sp. Nm166 TaxID=1881054 RepID=UPI0008E26E3D|nr:DUF3619 family protein [Nitrosomonas sp. Nm166]SFE43049.1 Protein of unknown function [Nitrosomonas sp. Nm166]
MSEQELGKEIAKLLDFSADENIKQSTLYRLQFARRAALENYHPPLKIMNLGSGASVYGGHGVHFPAAKLLLLLTILFVLMNIVYSQFGDIDKNAAIDTMILADDLPIDAYIDNEFNEWLDSE